MSVIEALEPFARFAFYFPIAFIAYQVLNLSRLLPSRAWMRLGIGFGLVAVLRAVPLFVGDLQPYLTMPYLTGLVIAYAFIAWGFATFTKDVRYVLDLNFRRKEEAP